MSKKEKLLASAQKSLQKNQVGKAIKDYQKIVQADPKDIRSRQKLAELLGRDKKIAQALEEYEAVAKHYADSGFYLKAIAVYKQMQKLDQGQVDIYHHLAELNEKQGLVGNAMAEYRNLVAHYEAQEMFSEALGVLQKMRELEPENLNVLVKIAESYARTGESEEARKEFVEALNMLRVKGDFGRVLKLYEIFLPLFPEEPEMKVGLAEALIDRGDAQKGIQVLQSLLKEEPEHPGVLRALAAGYRKTGSHDNERLTYLHLLRHSPDDLQLREKALLASIDSGELGRAKEEIAEWQGAFEAAGKSEVVSGLLARLETAGSGEEPQEQGREAEEAPVQAEAPAAEEMSLAADEIDHAPEGLTLDDSLLEDEPELSEEESAEPADEDEEIPLEFLESVDQEVELGKGPEPPPLEEQSAPATEEASGADAGSDTAVGPATDEPLYAPEEDVDLEVEIDMDGVEGFEFDLTEDEEGEGERAALPAEEQDVSGEIEELDEVEELEELETLEEIEELEELEELDEVVEPAPEDDAVASEALGEPSSVSGRAAAFDLHAELEEAEFYLQQGLLDDAERICRSLLEDAPEASDVRAKLSVIEERREKAAPVAGDVEGLFDLASELSDEEFPALDEARVESADSQKGVRTVIDGEDTESHYNLGIAYKEMGLLEDAVAEFDKAMGSPGRRVACLTLKGICLAESGAHEEGEQVFREALGEDLREDERTSLHYELGVLYQHWDRPSDALASFEAAAAADLFFRDVGEKIEALRKDLGMSDGNGGEDDGGKGNKDRVSYV